MPCCARNCSCTCSIMVSTLAIKSLAISQCPWDVRNSIALCRSGRAFYIMCGESPPASSTSTQSRLQIQHSPLPMRHAPAEEVTVHGLSTLARSVLLLQSHTLAFPAFIELHQDAIRVAEKHCANVPMRIAKRIGWPTGLGPMGEQAL